MLRGTQQIKSETPHTPTTTTPATQPITAQQLKELKETKKAKADAWKRLIPIAYEISELRQSGEKPFETEEVIKSLCLNYSYDSSISVLSLPIPVIYLGSLQLVLHLTILSLLLSLHSCSFFTPTTPSHLLFLHSYYSFTPTSSIPPSSLLPLFTLPSSPLLLLFHSYFLFSPSGP